MRNTNTAKKRIFTMLLCVVMFMSLVSVQAVAAGVIDTDKDVTLNMHYVHNEKALTGAQFDIYYVASVSPYAEFTLTDDFADYPIRVDGLEKEGWNDLALTLKGYIQRDGITPVDSGKTDGDGAVSFPTNNTVDMKAGLYLVVGKVLYKDGYSYTCAPFMVCLPNMDLEANDWKYNVTVFPKTVRDMAFDSPDSPTVTRKVLKVWDDNGNSDSRPPEITVQLFCDGVLFDTVILSRENNWRYTWSGLERGHDWSVTEEETEGYTVNVTQQGATFVVTNSKSGSGSGNSDDKLPQTGVLWWPVILIGAGGVLFLCIGIISWRKWKHG